MGDKRLIAAISVPAALAAACVFAVFLKPVDLRTSLYDLVGSAAEAIPAAVRDYSARIVPVLVSSTDAALSRAAADRLVARLPTNDCSAVRYRFDGESLSETLDFCGRHRAGLASGRDEALLETPEGRSRIARAAVRRYYSSPVPPLFPPVEDPFCLTDSFVTSLGSSFSGWTPSDGVLSARRGGRVYVLVVLELKETIARDTESLISFKARLDEAVNAQSSPDVTIEACGVALHTAVTAERCRREINALTCFSLAFIALLSFCVFKSFRWIAYLCASLAVASLAGALALLVFFPSIHVMTFVFGTTVLGLVIDYSFHWLLRSAARKETARNLLVSFATTEISLLPLMLSTLPVLRQSAVFLGTGLAAALVYVLKAYPVTRASPAAFAGGVRHRFAFAGSLVLAATVSAGLFRVEFATDPSAVYRPDASLAATERFFAELSGTADGTRGFLVTTGSDDLEELLSIEASVGLSGKTPSLSRFLPSFSRREKIAANVAKLYDEHAGKLKDVLGLKSFVPPPSPEPWKWSDIPPFASSFVCDRALVVPSAPPPRSPLPEGVIFCRPKSLLAGILSDWADETRTRLLASLALMFAALAAFFRARAFVMFVPSLAALFCAAGWLGLTGESVNLFHLLACFLLTGMAVDYTVFLHGGGRAALKPALCSLLTSVAGFGALVFVSFPVVNAFGVVLAIGLPAAFFAACVTAPAKKEATEIGASALGLEILYAVYRVFGLKALHAGAASVGLFLWVFSRAVRRASPAPRKVIAFTHSLADKLVVMAGGRSLPKVETDGSLDARGFLDDVARKRGVFVLSSHCGTVEVLAALGECDVTFHAWMEFDRTSVFNAFYIRHASRAKVVIRPISSFGPETVFEAGDALERGDCLVMAGDRGFGRMRTVPFGSGETLLPEGAFRFARALEHNVYFVACVAVAPCRYRAIVRRLPSDSADAMARAYASSLYETTRSYPHQWFKWEGQAE